MTAAGNLNALPFVSVDHMMRLVLTVGIERFLTELAGYIEEDFRRWEHFDKTPRVASHSTDGFIELMPTSDGALYVVSPCVQKNLTMRGGCFGMQWRKQCGRRTAVPRSVP